MQNSPFFNTKLLKRDYKNKQESNGNENPEGNYIGNIASNSEEKIGVKENSKLKEFYEQEKFIKGYMKSKDYERRRREAEMYYDSEESDPEEMEWSANFNRKIIEPPFKLDKKTPILIFHDFKNSSSKITYYPCSDFRKLELLKQVYNITTVVSCIERTEYQEKIKITCYKNKIEYEKVIFDIISNSDNFNQQELLIKIADCIRFIYNKATNQKETTLVHSGSGTQRSSMVIYCLMRLNGENNDEARKIVERMKRLRRNIIGDYSLEFAEKYLVPILISKSNKNLTFKHNIIHDEVQEKANNNKNQIKKNVKISKISDQFELTSSVDLQKDSANEESSKNIKNAKHNLISINNSKESENKIQKKGVVDRDAGKFNSKISFN